MKKINEFLSPNIKLVFRKLILSIVASLMYLVQLFVALMVLFLNFLYIQGNKFRKSYPKSFYTLFGLCIGASSVFLFLNAKQKKYVEEKIASAETFFGIDVSHHNKNINWQKVASGKHPVKFSIIKATEGTTIRDERFNENIEGARSVGLIVGAYHFYSLLSSPETQAKNYINSVELRSGDFVPVLDLENYPKSEKDLPAFYRGVKTWLSIVEKHYGKKPIIYTGLKDWEYYLAKKGFDEYPKWIAAYSEGRRDHEIVTSAEIFQFTEKVRVDGIPDFTDGSDLNKTEKVFM